uniref:CRAL-TRIO domain-containing protein n=1 Tax=Panagrolaimus sp. JU765 TaxID=591449 RepID=A0AC34RQG6_9BILA
MTKEISTLFGQKLSSESKKLVDEVRSKLKQPIHPKFDKDFNIYRFVLNAERQYNKKKDIIEHAIKTLDHHLRYRQCLNLDELPDISMADNPLFAGKYLPSSEILNATDSNGRVLCYFEAKTMSLEGAIHSLRSTAACRFQFYHFEHTLRKINEQEDKTGKLSSLRYIVDLNGYEINPFMMLFVTSGDMSYYSTLFHYENYPELVHPMEIVNVPKWIHMPYRLFRSMMPPGFTEKFKLHDGHFIKELEREIDEEDIPVSLGGINQEIQFTAAEIKSEDEYWQPPSETILNQLENLHIYARKQKIIKIQIDENSTKKTLSWYFKNDGDIYFGIFYDLKNDDENYQKDDEIDMDTKIMIYPFFKILGNFNLVHEFDFIDLKNYGTYYLCFCNKHCWLHRRNVEILVELSYSDGSEPERIFYDGKIDKNTEGILKTLKLRDFKDS